LEFIILFLFLLCSFFTLINKRELKILSREISFLNGDNVSISNSILGKNMKEFLVKETHHNQKSSKSLLIFSLTTCSTCHPEIEELIDLFNRYEPFPTTIVLVKEDSGAEDFQKKYNNYFSINISSIDIVEEFVVGYPTIFLLNEKHHIEYEFANVQTAFSLLMNSQRINIS
jgi:hypothetical protein